MRKGWSRPVLTVLARSGSNESVLAQQNLYCRCASPDPKYGSESIYSNVCGTESSGLCSNCWWTPKG